jgi:hypothetical protein
MKRLLTIGIALICICSTAGFSQEPEWNAAAIKPCDRTCLVGVVDGYMNAIFKHDPELVPPLSIDVRMTENTGQMDVGEGVIWRSKVEPTGFKLYVADPIEGQVAIQTRLKIQGRDALVAVRLKVDRGKISEDWVTAGLQVPEIETKKGTPSRNQNTSCELLGLFPA